MYREEIARGEWPKNWEGIQSSGRDVSHRAEWEGQNFGKRLRRIQLRKSWSEMAISGLECPIAIRLEIGEAMEVGPGFPQVLRGRSIRAT